MNNKLMSYEDAVKRLRYLESKQKRYKSSYYRNNKSCRIRRYGQSEVSTNKESINQLLTIIHLHKKARKMYGKLRSEGLV